MTKPEAESTLAITPARQSAIGALRRGNLPEQVVKLLSERIRSGQYKCGEKLPSEQVLIEEFGVSRTVVREAIANLKAGGVISTRQGVGAFVVQSAPVPPFSINPSNLELINEIIAVLELRIALEAEAAALAAVRRSESHLSQLRESLRAMATAVQQDEDAIEPDLSFHRTIALAAGNRHLLTLFNYLGELVIPRTRLQTFKLNGTTRKDYLDRVHREHAQILVAIEQSDPEGARAAMRLHLIGSKDRLRASAQGSG